jgi:hypothetical protein
MPRLNGKFVSREKYESVMASDEATQISPDSAVTIEPPTAEDAWARTAYITEENPVSEETVTVERKTRTVDPITAATAVVRKAKKELDRVTAIHAKRTAVPSLEDAQAAYDAAVVVLQDALNV